MFRYVAATMLLLMLLSVSACLHAMPGVLDKTSLLYRGWSVEAGLPQVSVTAMAQDEQGYIWLGTQGGLARFDGHQFTVFNTANTPQLLSNLITSLYVDSKNRLWIGTVNGLSYYADDHFTTVDTHDIEPGTITSFAELPDGRFFIGANQLYQWQQNQLQPVAEHAGPVFQLYQQDSILWIGGQDGFASYQQQQYRWYPAPAAAEALQVSELVARNNVIYLGTNKGLYQWQQNRWQHLALPGAAPNSRIELLYLDNKRQVWTSTFDGLYQVKPGQVIQVQQPGNASKPFSWIESMLEDQHQNVWLGSRAHGVIRLRAALTERYSSAAGIPDPYSWAVLPWQRHLMVGTSEGVALLRDGEFQPLLANQQLPSPFVYSLLHQQDNLWVGTRAGLSLLDADTLAWQKNFPQTAHLLITTMITEQQRIWVGSNGGLFVLENGELSQQGITSPLTDLSIRALLHDSSDRLWVGTESGLYLRSTEQFQPVLDMPLAETFISVIVELPDGNMLIGSFDQGFVLGKPGNWQHFSQLNGLPGNGVMHAALVNDKLIISNFEGFYRLDYPALQQGTVSQLYMLVDDRQPEAATDSHRCCNGAGSNKGAVHQNKLWFPTLDGIIALRLDRLNSYAPVPVPVMESLTAANQQFKGDTVKLAPEQRDWHFQFSAPYYHQASSIETRYRLEGYEQNWVDAGSRREAFYTNLPPGDYRFYVQVKVAGDYRWSDPTTIDIQLTPYWHETLTARLLLLGLLLALFWLVYRLRLASLANAREELSRQVTERTQELYLANQKLQQMSMQDALTELHNRHYLDVNIDAMLARAQRNNQPLAWVLLDLDNFKRINDQYGHQLGDSVLKHFAGILQQHSRSNDHLIRWGGEEFLMVLEQSSEIQHYIERLQQLVHNYPWQQQLGAPVSITCSIGATIQPPGWDWEYSLYLADAALYKVKNSGRADYMLLQPGPDAPASLTTSDKKAELDEVLTKKWLAASRGKQLAEA
ncbi:diguanylate cyclase (GGDEF) domain-containing protein [Arsukibacterium tuosuense]|uniref:diguanylate cyclase n=1 Tax=Arsukibacterium tuosuense TaxID=1323745 RepID=A0A285J8Y5_9GAMM|nr:ligand-binding sensor domain-containing diguanylate cyclase [Arsukibacterium tuosuense]SNY56724.1 diguanylate cyclase (GGDEF) domain-containing protein [Arsukibacterium tuosuense]